MTYQLVQNVYGENISVIKRVEDNAFIPNDPANTDYQEYLEWVAEGNTITPADS